MFAEVAIFDGDGEREKGQACNGAMKRLCHEMCSPLERGDLKFWRYKAKGEAHGESRAYPRGNPTLIMLPGAYVWLYICLRNGMLAAIGAKIIVAMYERKS